MRMVATPPKPSAVIVWPTSRSSSSWLIGWSSGGEIRTRSSAYAITASASEASSVCLFSW